MRTEEKIRPNFIFIQCGRCFLCRHQFGGEHFRKGDPLDPECTFLGNATDEVIDLLQGGQGVFGIAVGRVWREVEGSLAELPLERSEPVFVDELAERRRSKLSAS